jgi:hypothetical protein
MKKVLFSTIIITVMMSVLTSCGVSLSHVSNSVTTVTHVQLSQNNFKVLGRVSGSAHNWYILGFGGLLSQSLYGEAKNEMLQKANLTGVSRAVIDITYDVHTRTIVVFSDYTITATGTLIEFTDPGVVRNSNESYDVKSGQSANDKKSGSLIDKIIKQ